MNADTIKHMEQARGSALAIVLFAVIRIAIHAGLGTEFFLLNQVVYGSTIVGGIVLPVAAFIVCTPFKTVHHANPKAGRALMSVMIVVLAAAVLVAILGMSHFAPYSYTVFDTLVKDMISFINDNDTGKFFINIFDNMFVLVVIGMIAQAMGFVRNALTGKPYVPPGAKRQPPVPVAVQPVPRDRFPCPACGTPCETGARFCSQCASALGPATPVDEQPVQDPLPAPDTGSAGGTVTFSTISHRPPPVVSPPAAPRPAATIRSVPPRAESVQPITGESIRAFFKQTGLQIEAGFGKLYAKAFKKEPTRKTTWNCIGLIAVLVIALVIIGAFAWAAANPLAGTWRTSGSVTFHIRTDFRTGVMQDEGTQERIMTWLVSPTWDPAKVDIEVRFDVTGSSINSGSGYTPDVSPMFLYGFIDGNLLNVTTHGSMFTPRYSVGLFTFNAWSINGTWNDSWCLVYCQDVYTAPGALVLIR